jgi:hypothetical protein
VAASSSWSTIDEDEEPRDSRGGARELAFDVELVDDDDAKSLSCCATNVSRSSCFPRSCCLCESQCSATHDVQLQPSAHLCFSLWYRFPIGPSMPTSKKNGRLRNGSMISALCKEVVTKFVCQLRVAWFNRATGSGNDRESSCACDQVDDACKQESSDQARKPAHLLQIQVVECF